MSDLAVNDLPDDVFDGCLRTYHRLPDDEDTLAAELISMTDDVEALRAVAARAYAAGRQRAAAAVRAMPAYPSDQLWEEECRRAEKAGWNRKPILARRSRDDFTTMVINGMYQITRDTAAKVAVGEVPPR